MQVKSKTETTYTIQLSETDADRLLDALFVSLPDKTVAVLTQDKQTIVALYQCLKTAMNCQK